MKNIKKYLTIFAIIVATLPGIALADDMANKYFSKTNPKLTDDEKAALRIVEDWDKGKNCKVKPTVGRNGEITYVFGAQRPSIVCAPLQITDVELQPGEVLDSESVKLGDSVRWSVEPAYSGNGSQVTVHLIIKTKDVNLETSLVVATNRRTYHFKLRSHRTKYMAKVSFVYPEDSMAKWRKARTFLEQERDRNTIMQTGEYLGDLDFEYKITGSGLKPVRVYNDGRKTIIQMPKEMKQTEAPALLVIRQNGDSSSEEVIVNYRIQGDRYIVDQVFNKAIMVAGVGSNQNRVEISRRDK